MGFGYVADKAFLSWTSFTKSLFTYSSHGLQEPWMFSQSPCLHRPILRSHKPDLSTVNLCYFSVYLPLVSHNLHTIERNCLAEILISFPVFFVDQIGHRYAFYCWVGKKKNEIKARTLWRSRQPQAKASRTPGGIHSGMSLLVKKELWEGVSLF